MAEPLLQLDGVTKRFGGNVAVDAVTCDLAAGELTSLIGPNGAGKSTLVNLIAGRARPDAGRLTFRGQPLPAGAARVARAGVGRLFQDVRLFPSLSVLENVMAAVPDQPGEGLTAALLSRRRVARREREVRELALAQLEFVGLAERAEALAGSLSYGQQKLVALARLLAGGASLLLLDEPAAGLNPRLVAELAGLLRRLRAGGRTLVLIEHDMGLVREVSDRVLLLDRGALVADGAPAEVFGSEVLASVYGC